MKKNIEDDSGPKKKIPSPFLIPLVGFFMLVGFTTTAIEDDLPWVIGEQSIQAEESNIFSEESANKYLRTILGDYPRVFGTEYHYIKTRDFKELFDDVANNSNIPIYTDWQFVDGNFSIFSSPSVYRNLSNVVAVLEGESGVHANGTLGTSILVNCHYDSVPFAIGASDDGVFCAAMVETLEKLSRRKTKLKHNVIFLSNGAEEMGLQGSHGFLSHPWSKSAIAVVNLEAAGMNGRPNLFQVTDPRVLEAFRRTTSRPMAQSLAEFLFTNNIIPSDTDFRIWRDFGDIMGIDIAFVQWGHIYHTRNDKPELLHDGVMQNAGNMLLPLVRDLANNEDLVNRVPLSSTVYFDYLGWFMITLTRPVALTIDIITIILALSTIPYSMWLFGVTWSYIRELLWALVGRLICLASGVAVIAVFTSIMIATTIQMRYLSAYWLVVPLYWLPYLIASVAVSHLFDFWRCRNIEKTSLDASVRAIQAMAATRFIMSMMLLVLCCFPVFFNVRYLITTPLLLMTFGSCVSMTVVRFINLKCWQHMLLEVVVHLPATLFTFSLATRLLGLMIPITGRSASDSPDVLITIASVVLTLYVASTVSGIELLFSRKWLWIVLSGVSIVCIVLMFVPMNPYRDEITTQRQSWFHSQITTYDANLTVIDRSSGVLMTKTDANNIQSALTAIRRSSLYAQGDAVNDTDGINRLQIREDDLRIIQEECQQYIFCNMPIFRGQSFTNSLFVKMDPPAYFNQSLRLLASSCVENICTLSFEIEGPAHNMITIWPRANVTLISWPFDAPITTGFRLHGRPAFNFRQNTNTYSEVFQPFEFTLTFNVPQALQADIIVDMILHAHRINHPEDFTDHYKQLVEVMPEYMNIATFLSFRSNYVFKGIY